MAIAAASDGATAPAATRAPHWLRRFAIVSWIGWAVAILSLWVQYHLGVYDTLGWLWLPFAGIGAVAAVAVLTVGLFRAVVGPRRRAMPGWALVGFTPVILTALLVGDMFFEQSRKNLPNTQVHKIGRMAAVTLLKGHAQLRYPHRLETARLIMYYDDRVTEPASDVAAMDAHLARLEGVLGRRQHSRIHWVRGRALGMHAMSIHSVALASEVSPAGWFDRHELAHSFMYQFSDPGSEPPMLLLEGWAMAVDDHPEPLKMAALACRGPAKSCLANILSPEDYHRGKHEAYFVGGALVDYLLRRHGPEPFLDFYNSCRPASYKTDFERAYGVNFLDMENAFWQEMERTDRPKQ